MKNYADYAIINRRRYIAVMLGIMCGAALALGAYHWLSGAAETEAIVCLHCWVAP